MSVIIYKLIVIVLLLVILQNNCQTVNREQYLNKLTSFQDMFNSNTKSVRVI